MQRLNPLLAAWKPDGIIAEVFSPALARLYSRSKLPLVEVFQNNQQPCGIRILPDDVAVGRMAAEHFLNRGFRHYAYFGNRAKAFSRARGEGFREAVMAAFARHLLDRRDAHFTFTTLSWRGTTHHAAKSLSDLAKIRAWIAKLPRPLALFAGNDQWGFELVQVVRGLGLHVPYDVAVLGVDDDESHCEIADPPLSSIQVGFERMGRVAVDLLEQMFAGQRPEPPQLVPPLGVATRQSTDVLAVDDADVANALRHIRKHSTNRLTVASLLEIIPLNRRTLERRFVSAIGRTPLEEIHRVCIEQAKQLLLLNLSISEVARRSGFGSAEYFAARFKLATGSTPSEYRDRA